jgi:putative tricarboxylic transport membrane protein
MYVTRTNKGGTPMRRVWWWVAFAAVVVALSAGASVGAPAYPSRPVLFIAPATPGGGWDLTARSLAKTLQDEKLVPTPISVTNMTGGSGIVALAHIANNRRADPYTLAVFSPSLLYQIALKRTPLGVKDFTPIAALTADYGVLIVRRDSPYTDLRSILQAYSRNPSGVAIGGGSAPGGQDHIGGALMLKAAGQDATKMKFVAFQSGGDAMLALLGGHVDALFVTISQVVSQFEAGQIRPLAIFAEQRLSSPFRDVPVGREQGASLIYPVWRGMYMPPGVSAESVQYWDGIFRKLRATKAWHLVLDEYKWFDTYMSPDRFAPFVAKEVQDYETVLKELGFLR